MHLHYLLDDPRSIFKRKKEERKERKEGRQTDRQKVTCVRGPSGATVLMKFGYIPTLLSSGEEAV